MVPRRSKEQNSSQDGCGNKGLAAFVERTGGLSTASGRNVDCLKSSRFAEDRGQGVTNLKVRLPYCKKGAKGSG
jgi:hypothetical protein